MVKEIQNKNLTRLDKIIILKLREKVMKKMKVKLNTMKMIKSVSDDTRLMVIMILLQYKDGVEVGVSEFRSQIKCEPTLLSHHLSILRKRGILLSRRDGKRVFYKFNKKVVSRKSLDLGEGLKLSFKDYTGFIRQVTG